MTWSEITSITQQLSTDDDRRRFNALLNSAFCEYPHCERFGELRRQGSAYAHALSNWARYCDEHQEEANAYWDEMWREYYAGVL